MNTPGPTRTTKPSTRYRYLAFALNLLLGSALLALVYGLFIFLPVTYNDWYRFFQPAALALANPYRVPGILNPPWTFVLLYPLAQLPGRLSGAGIAFLSALAVTAYARSPWKTLAICASAPFVFIVVLGQLDALILYGFLLPTIISPLVILIKPQGAVLTLANRLTRRSLVVLALCFGVSLVIWRWWPVEMLRYGLVPDPVRNASLFPYT